MIAKSIRTCWDAYEQRLRELLAHPAGCPDRLSYLPKEDKYLEMLLPNNWQPKLKAKSTNELIMEK